MGEFSDYASLVYPAMWDHNWGPEVPVDTHVTLFPLGNISELNYGLDDVVDALSAVDFNIFIWVNFIGMDRFGELGDIPVWLVDSMELFTKLDVVEQALNAVGIKNGSKFTDYRPHITVPEDIWLAHPNNMLLSPAEVWWGDDRYGLG